MRRILFLLILPFFAFSQQTINDSIIHDSVYRNFITYIPAVYDVSSPTPLLFNLHGRTGTALSTMYHADFRDIADTANFIIVHPQGLLDNNGNTYWNYGQTSVDDLGFLNSLYSHLVNIYNIDVDRVYSSGMSNGAAMSYRLACDMSDKIAAIASVTGAMTSFQFQSCNPIHPTPILQIHGTNDTMVNFYSMVYGLDYWRNYNNCDIIADTFPIPNYVISDSSTVDHITFRNGNNGVTTELFKIYNGGHTWPGSSFTNNNGITNYDINASVEIWKFFSKYDINGLISTSTFVAEIESKAKKLIKVVDVLGKESLPISNTPLFFIFDDGSVEKKLIIK
jgi:polyhydroxybutyrate depolymerase